MKSHDKARWVAALRSKEYPQAKGYLRTTQGYCCLGVWCDLRDPSGWADEPVSRNSSNEPLLLAYQYTAQARGPKLHDDLDDSYGQTSSYTSLPNAVVNEIVGHVPGMESSNSLRWEFPIPLTDEVCAYLSPTMFDVKALKGCHSVRLAQLNDNGLNFDQIADFIERFVPTDDGLEPAGEVAP